MFWKRHSIKLPLTAIKTGNELYQYFITLHSSEKKLTFLIDSGATHCIIKSSCLEGCQYQKSPYKVLFTTIAGHPQKLPTVVMFLRITDYRDSKEFCNSFRFIVVLEESIPALYQPDIAGILGSNFLQFCAIDFLKGYLKIYLQL